LTNLKVLALMEWTLIKQRELDTVTQHLTDKSIEGTTSLKLNYD